MLDSSLKERLRYCCETGNLYWNRIRVITQYDKTFNTRFADKVAGTIKPSDGYIQINFKGNLIPAHRIAWLLYYGTWPNGVIDHIDRIRTNNKIENLRDVTHKINCRNQSKRKTNTSGNTGLYLCGKTQKWVVRIKVDGISKSLGYFKCKNKALQVRVEAEKLNGFHRTHGK